MLLYKFQKKKLWLSDLTYILKKLNLWFDQQVFAASVKLSEEPNVSTISPSSDQTL